MDSDVGETLPVSGRIFTLDDMPGAGLEVGDVITGLQGSRTLNAFEINAAQVLEPRFVSREAAFLIKPLATVLTPPRFWGDLRDGVAVVVPTDLSEVNNRGSNHSQEDTLSATLALNMYSGGRVVGNVTREVTYFKRRSGREFYGSVARHLGSSASVLDGAEVADALNADSSERAARVASLALRNVYSAGLVARKR